VPRCSLDACPVAKDGRCLEGRGADCPNLLSETEVAAAAESVEAPETVGSRSPTFEPLPGRFPLELAEARAVSRRGPCAVVALVGMPECGKTSLLARLHQMFQAGPVAGFDFAGSRSLPHFEELNWLATVESGGSHVTMHRSSSQFDNSFLHISVRSRVDQGRIEVLLNDITGETFEKAVASQPKCDDLIGLARADHLVVLVDGAALASSGTRHHHLEQVRDFLQRVDQGGQCGKHTALHIAISKLDKLHGHEAIVDGVAAGFSERPDAAMGSVRFWRLAARPTDGSLPTTDDIAQMFLSWITITHRYPTSIPSAVPRGFWARDFCRYGG
jgi:hypothetical protein